MNESVCAILYIYFHYNIVWWVSNRYGVVILPCYIIIYSYLFPSSVVTLGWSIAVDCFFYGKVCAVLFIHMYVMMLLPSHSFILTLIFKRQFNYLIKGLSSFH